MSRLLLENIVKNTTNYLITIPPEVKPGTYFNYSLNGQLFKILCPETNRPGHQLLIQVPSFSASSSPVYIADAKNLQQIYENSETSCDDFCSECSTLKIQLDRVVQQKEETQNRLDRTQKQKEETLSEGLRLLKSKEEWWNREKNSLKQNFESEIVRLQLQVQQLEKEKETMWNDGRQLYLDYQNLQQEGQQILNDLTKEKDKFQQERDLFYGLLQEQMRK